MSGRHAHIIGKGFYKWYTDLYGGFARQTAVSGFEREDAHLADDIAGRQVVDVFRMTDGILFTAMRLVHRGERRIIGNVGHHLYRRGTTIQC